MRSKFKQTKRELQSFDAPPLDFANLNIKSLSDLKYLRPKQGRRKDILTDREEAKDEIKKKADQLTDSSQQQNATQVTQQQNQEEEQIKDGEEEEKEKERERKEKERIKEQRGIPAIVRTIVPNQPALPISQNVQLQSSTKGNNTRDEQAKKNTSQKLQVKLIQSSLILSYNKIRSLTDFYSVVDQVMFDCKNLQWIDLSHNYLETLDYEDFIDFQMLKSLYLHGNYLSRINDLEKLQGLSNLRSLTIHGNPLDTVPNFRLYVLGILPHLKKLDSVLVSRKELDNTLVWKQSFHMVNAPLPKTIIRPQTNQDSK